ncbi:MAG TPA: hypothetical protein VE029_05805 [Rhizobacter sp.]|nr:hypothetical protein [Rhizobacter sp.]
MKCRLRGASGVRSKALDWCACQAVFVIDMLDTVLAQASRSSQQLKKECHDDFGSEAGFAGQTGA